MKYTLEQCKEDMMQMWKWLYENPGKNKYAFEAKFPQYPDCACCEYDEVNNFPAFRACSCPIKWTSSDGECGFNSEFDLWDRHQSRDICCDEETRLFECEYWARRIYELAKGIK